MWTVRRVRDAAVIQGARTSVVGHWTEGLQCRGALRRAEPMARHCTWRAGGPADVLFEPEDRSDLLAFLPAIPADVPIAWIGLGSNVLVRDAGFPGVIVLTGRALDGIAHTDGRISVEAGVPCPKAARYAAAAGYAGAEFLVGIPGSIGGALAMNAGAFGSDIWRWVQGVETADRTGCVRCRPAEDYRVGYRSVNGPAGEWFLGCELVFEPAAGYDPLVRGRELLAERAATQPTGAASCGSVFRNPPGDYAGRLVEAAGLKGFRVGGCQVSEKHANFIINDRGANATDIETLISTVRHEVQRRFGVALEPEVQILGAGGSR